MGQGLSSTGVDTVSGRAGASACGADPNPLAECSRGTLSPNTERAMRADLAIYRAWCHERGVEALPATAKTIAAFVDAMAHERAPATVRRYVTSVAAAHRALGREKPAQSEAVREALRRMHRRRGRRQAQAEGLTAGLRRRLLDATGTGLIDARNRAMLALAYDTLLRRGELVAVEVDDLVEETDGTGTLLVRHSKGDPEGWGATLFVARDTMAFVHAWRERSAVHSGRLFRSLARGALGLRLDASQVPRILKAMARDAGLTEQVVETISGHSTRVGATQDMVASGIGIAAIQQAGRWKTPSMVHRYGERLLARRSGAAQLARLQNRG